MGQTLLVAQLVIALVLAFFILIQAKGKGFGRMWGGGSFSRRGLESLVFKGTFVLSFLFIVISILSFAF